MKDRPDATAASLAAQAAGELVEDLSARSETSQVFANPDGTWTQETASGPVRVADETTGTWHDIDTDVVLTADGEGLAAKYASADVVFSTGGDKTFATVRDENGKRSSFGWPTVLPEPIVDGDTVTYRGAIENGDLVVTALPTGFSHSVVLREAPTGALEIPIPVAIPDGELVEKANGSLVLNSDGEKVVAAPQPLMWDATDGADGLPANVEKVEAEVETAGAGDAEKQTLVLSPDEVWLSDPKTVYPVTVDPSYTMYANGDSWVQNAGYTTSQGGSEELRAGTYDAGTHKARSFVKFISMLNDNGGAGQDIVSATFKMRNYYSGSCTSAPIRISRITETWTVGDLSWGNQPSITSTGSSTFSDAFGYSASCEDSGYQAAWDATAIVQAWADGAVNYGIRVAADTETSNYTWRRYRSSEYSNADVRPRMAVTYNSYPNTATAPAVLGATSYGGITYVRKNTFNVSSKVTDPDGGTLTGLFDVAGPAGSWVSLGGSAVPSGASSVRSFTLNTDGVYTTKARARDSAGLVSKAYSTATVLTVDTTRPVAPTVSCTNGFTDGVHIDDPASDETTCSFTGSSDTAYYLWSRDGGAEVKVVAQSSGAALGATGLLSLSQGPTEIDVRAVDKAGNVSELTTFGFSTGLRLPGIPAFQSMSPCATSCDESVAFTTSLTPTLTVISESEDEQSNVTLSWELRKASSAVLAASYSSVVAPNSASSWDVPAGLLEDDNDYEYRVAASVGDTSSGWSDWLDLRVDMDAGSVTEAERNNAIEKVAAVFNAQNDVWLTGEAAATAPSAELVAAAGGATAAFQAALDSALDLRGTVTGEGLQIVDSAATIDKTYVQRTSSGLRVLADSALDQVYFDPQTLQESEATIGDTFILELPSLAGTWAARMFTTADPDSTGLAEMKREPESSEVVDATAPGDDEEPVSETARPPATEEEPQNPGDVTTSDADRWRQSYDTAKFRDYALYWTEKPRKNEINPGYPKYKNNCANFASQALVAGGWKMTGGWRRGNLSNWTWNLKGPYGPSYTWSLSRWLFDYMVKTKKLSRMDNIWNAEPGDLYFMDWASDADKTIDHVAVVTGRTKKGVPRISQKTKNRHNMLLTTWIKIIDESSGKNPNWYGVTSWTKS